MPTAPAASRAHHFRPTEKGFNNLTELIAIPPECQGPEALWQHIRLQPLSERVPEAQLQQGGRQVPHAFHPAQPPHVLTKVRVWCKCALKAHVYLAVYS